ncbi:RICIN domain-containing protein [Candidatus Ichthyocystis hellenicum]|uniref:RICIN domain-containing protein n=1 Tax=Candidatus Ichthyocystis hellenicum TaxID=1561003 RepID=UPI000A9D52BE|nr:RICIN domain-containing protein [Candidatus Ichthyocystis hellenicum]
MLDIIKTFVLLAMSFVVGVSSASASSCKNVFFSHYTDKNYVISVDDRELVRTFLSADYNIGERGQKWALFDAYSSILPGGGKPMFYVSLADNERKTWGIEFFGSFWFQAELSPLDYSPWSILEAVPVEGLPGVIMLHSPAAEEKVQTKVCLSPITTSFSRTAGNNILRFQACSIHPKEWNYWIPLDTETGENCTKAVLSKSNYHSPVTVDPRSLCSSVFLKPVLSGDFFLSAKDGGSYSTDGIFLDSKNMFSFNQVWIPKVDFLPSSTYLFINLVWGQDKDYVITFVKGTELVPAHAIIGKFSGGSSKQAWLISSSRSNPGSFAILDASSMSEALTVSRDFKVGTAVSVSSFSDNPSQLWRAISTQTGTDCSSVFINSFSGVSVGNIISAKTNRAAVPTFQGKKGDVTINWQPGTGGSDVYYTILHSDIISPASGFSKQLHYAVDPTKCFIPLFSSTDVPHLALVNCMKDPSAVSVWRFGGLERSKAESQFCIDDQDSGKIWCLADVAGSFADPVDGSGHENPDTMMYFSEHVTGVPTLFASGNGLCLGVDENAGSKNFVSISCRENLNGFSIGKFSLVPASAASDPQKKYFITLRGSGKSVLCYGDRNGTLSFGSCDQKNPSLQWEFLEHGRIKNVAHDLCLSAGDSGNTPVYGVSCNSSHGPQVIFFTPSHSGVGVPNVFMQFHHWDLVRWTDDGLCVTAVGEGQGNSQEPCADPTTDKGKHQLWWRRFSQTGFTQGVLISAADNKLVLSMSGGYILAYQTVSTWGGWSVQKFLMYNTFQAGATDSLGISYCYSDGNPGHPSTSSIVADSCKEDWGVGIENQTWLFTPIIIFK